MIVIRIGGSAFPAGRREGDFWIVEEHGKTVQLYASEGWASCLAGWAMAGSAIACAIGVLTLYCRGDIVEND